MNLRLKKIFSKFCLVYFCVSFLDVVALSGVMINPKRLIFEDKIRFKNVELINFAEEPKTYDISFEQKRMNEDGSFETIESPDEGQRFASPYIRVFPRRVTIPPKGTQIIKVQLIKLNQLTDGEYRSHLKVESVLDDKPLKVDTEQSSEGLSFDLQMVFATTIPVFIKRGTDTTSIDIVKASIEEQESELKDGKKEKVFQIIMNRLGNMSIYGSIEVEYVGAKKAGKRKKVGEFQGFAIYAPNASRIVSFSLDFSKIKLGEGGLYITFTERYHKKKNAVYYDLKTGKIEKVSSED